MERGEDKVGDGGRGRSEVEVLQRHVCVTSEWRMRREMFAVLQQTRPSLPLSRWEGQRTCRRGWWWCR